MSQALDDTAAPSRIRRRLTLGLLFAVALGIGARFALRASVADLIRDARRAAVLGDLDRAELLARQVINRAPHSPEALILAGEIASRRGDSEQALRYYDQVDDTHSRDSVVALGAAADLLIQEGRLTPAEARLRRILAVNPRHVTGLRRLAALLVTSGRRRESLAPLYELMRLQECDVDELALLGNVDQVFDDDRLFDRFKESAANDPLIQLAAARNFLLRHEPSRAAPLLRDLVSGNPQLLEARIRLGESLLAVGMLTDLGEWIRQFPVEHLDHPDVWLLRGKLSQLSGNRPAAIRSFWEAARQDPGLREAHALLGQFLAADGDSRSTAFVAHAERLRALALSLKSILRDGPTPDSLLAAARQSAGLGRIREAHAWYAALARKNPKHDETIRERERLASQITSGTPRTLPEFVPASQVDFSDHPLVGWTSLAPDVCRTARTSDASQSNFQFADEAQRRGIDFTYVNGDDPAVPGMGIWQGFGGGVAAFDYDGDGHCDLHFTQGGAWPPQSENRTHFDQLFRNTGTGSFRNVTTAAGVGDPGYSHGVTAADLDNDGFPDLFVANIGGNRLYQNQGDGTFLEITRAAGLEGNLWSTSCVLADLNGDGYPDLYEVNYLAGSTPFTETCWNEALGGPRSCNPDRFQAAHDRLFLNRADGTFHDVSREAGIEVPDGKGLGVAVFSLAGDRRLSVFVANDGTPNFLFQNETANPGSPPRFVEHALAAGCALNDSGRAQAGMGIAVDDANGDGLVDLFVTNFYLEYNVLYQQEPGPLFHDVSGRAGVKEPSLRMLGFGTQFLDADLDGDRDLVLVNGHVDDYSEIGAPFRMRPQFFSNDGFGRFTEVSADDPGEFFGRQQLGRGMARIDWNRDGREDLAVSHLDTPAALVTNRTPAVGHFLTLHLRGVNSARDAIGAIVTVSAGGKAFPRQLTAGDGYFATNQRQLVIGLGEHYRIEEVGVEWPAGGKQTFRGLLADQEWVLVEGRPDAVVLHHVPEAE